MSSIGQVTQDDSVTHRVHQPVLFVSHGGGPCFFMDARESGDMFRCMSRDSAVAEDFRQLAVRHVAHTPAAILVVSAHYELADAKKLEVSSVAQNTMLYDYYGFPEHTYKLTYPAPGLPKLARRVCDLLNAHQGLRARQITCSENHERGLDHGAFIPLKCMYPAASIPVVNLSIHCSLEPHVHLALGHALAPLRDENVLVVCSGQSTHNFGDAPSGVVEQFEHFITATVCNANLTAKDRFDQLSAFKTACPAWKWAHHRPDHLVPLFVAMGAAGDDVGVKISEFFLNSFFSMSHIKFGA